MVNRFMLKTFEGKELKGLSKTASETSISVGKTSRFLGYSTFFLAIVLGYIQFCNYQLTRQTKQSKEEQQKQIESLLLEKNNIKNSLDSLSIQVQTVKDEIKKIDSILALHH